MGQVFGVLTSDSQGLMSKTVGVIAPWALLQHNAPYDKAECQIPKSDVLQIGIMVISMKHNVRLLSLISTRFLFHTF